MGNFYVNYTVRGPGQKEVAEALAGRTAIVTPSRDECLVVFDEESETQDETVIAALASKLSEKLQCPVLAVMNHDDDILWYQLYSKGQLLDEYDSTPGYFEAEGEGEEEEAEGPSGGDAQKLCEAFEVDNVDEVEDILRKPSGDEEGYVFAFMRHSDLVDALGAPSFAVGAGYNYVTSGEVPEGLERDELLMIS